MKTPIIQYNLRERGRKASGVPRHFNIPALVRNINSDEVQERVRLRDMIGYYGHWPRVKFGLFPSEGNLDKGYPAIAEPALVTIHLRAYPDGTIEHQAEFLDNDSGKVAEKLFKNKVGGFSSVIFEKSSTFCGFDYVIEPNYSTNRGYELPTTDSAHDLTLEDIDREIRNEQLHSVLGLLDQVQERERLANETIEFQKSQIEDLMSLLENRGVNAKSALDSIQHGIAPSCFGFENAESFKHGVSIFRNTRVTDLPRFEDEQSREKKDIKTICSFYQRLLKG